MKIKMNIICVFNLILWCPKDRDWRNIVWRRMPLFEKYVSFKSTLGLSLVEVCLKFQNVGNFYNYTQCNTYTVIIKLI